MYKLRTVVGKLEFSDQFSKIVIYYKRKGFSIDVIKQSASLEVDPITADRFHYLFNCTPVGLGSDYNGPDLKTSLGLSLRWNFLCLYSSGVV